MHPALLAEILRVAAVFLPIERARSAESFAPLLRRLREKGRSCKNRSGQARSCLQRAIRIVDRLFPGGPNCYRRVLLEVALDSGAARQPVYFGFRANGGPASGHAWLGPALAAADVYDAVFTV